MATNYHAKVSEMLQRTYDAHVLAEEPWGWSEELEACSYEAGCAIGVSLKQATAHTLDLTNGGSSIGAALTMPEIREELFGSNEDYPIWVFHALEEMQEAHDQKARNEDFESDEELRRMYGVELMNIARYHGLDLRG